MLGTFSNISLDVNKINLESLDLTNIIREMSTMKKRENPFKWDGTCLGEYNVVEKLQTFYYNNFEYWNVQINGWVTTCLIRRTKSYTPCLVDELKSIFGLIKLGTHYIINGGNYIILIKARLNINGDSIVHDTFLNQNINVDEETINKIKKIYVFRDLLCLNKSFDSSIVIRTNDPNDPVYPVSLIDSSIKLEKYIDIGVSTYLPETVYSRWIKEDSPSKILSNICKLKDSDKIQNRLYKLRMDITEIVEKVCKNEMSDFPGILLSRIESKLSYYVENKKNTECTYTKKDN